MVVGIIVGLLEFVGEHQDTRPTAEVTAQVLFTVLALVKPKSRELDHGVTSDRGWVLLEMGLSAGDGGWGLVFPYGGYTP